LGGVDLGISVGVGILLVGWRLRGSGLVVVLVADDGQDPGAQRLSVDGLCSPWTVCLLGRRLELSSGALVWLAAAVTDKIATDDLAALFVVPGDLVAMGARLDDLVAILGHVSLEILEQVVKGLELLAGANVDGPQDAEHGCGCARRFEGDVGT
jgi:hypothetical protein